jgi:acetate kinase
MYILVINSGSATLKCKLFNAGDLKVVFEGMVERIGLKDAFLATGKEIIPYHGGIRNHEEALSIVLMAISRKYSLGKKELLAIGHRVVHGGEAFTSPTMVNSKVLKRLEKYKKLAPLHNPLNLACIEACMKLLPGIKNIGVFDTAYYRTLPDYAFIYPLPLKFYNQYKIRRYGFHGISHEYATRETARHLKKPLKKLKIISCHLGSGSSITATKFGQAIDTSMGFTPLEGLMMSTRTGDLDPAIPLYLIKTLKFHPWEVDQILNKNSGLLGVAGTMDMREVLVNAGYKIKGFKAKKADSRKQKAARLALQIFIYRVQKYIGAYAAIMGGVDVIVFTGGIGERSEIIRKLVLKNLKRLGRFKTLVIPANEELMIAREVKKLINN